MWILVVIFVFVSLEFKLVVILCCCWWWWCFVVWVMCMFFFIVLNIIEYEINRENLWSRVYCYDFFYEGGENEYLIVFGY